MEKIISIPYQGVQVHVNKISWELAQSEMSYFGYILSDDEKILSERIDGTMVRTKAYHVAEGGIC